MSVFIFGGLRGCHGPNNLGIMALTDCYYECSEKNPMCCFAKTEDPERDEETHYTKTHFPQASRT